MFGRAERYVRLESARLARGASQDLATTDGKEVGYPEEQMMRRITKQLGVEKLY